MFKKDTIIWNALKLISWIIFIGLCIQTGTVLFNFLYSLVNSKVAGNLHLGLNLYSISQHYKLEYIALTSCVIILSALKAWVFYYVLKIFNTLHISKPFDTNIGHFLQKIAYLAASSGVLGHLCNDFVFRLQQKGILVSEIANYWNDRNAYLMMAAIMLVIAEIFKKGFELKTDNDLTV